MHAGGSMNSGALGQNRVGSNTLWTGSKYQSNQPWNACTFFLATTFLKNLWEPPCL